MQASFAPGIAELMVIGLVLATGLALVVAVVAVAVWLVTRSGARRSEELHRRQLDLLEQVNEGLTNMDRRVQALESLLPEMVERKEAQR